ncbi:MAG: phosphatase PAP2 family protein [Solirubrobacteraceae bacterium]
MLARLRKLQARILPRGWPDVFRQVALFTLAYAAYRVVRGLVENEGTAAFQHARDVIQIERSLHIFVEPSIQAWASGSHTLTAVASWLYVNAQFTITVGALLYLYVFQNGIFYRVRDVLLISLAIALIGYEVFPTAPPRFLPEWGFTDTVSNATNIHLTHSSAFFEDLFNPYAAVPSMHVAFALIIGWPLARRTRRLPVRALWCAYPLLIAFVIIATGNHFIFDTLLGALTAVLSSYAAGWLPRLRQARIRLAPAATGGATGATG